MSKFLTESERQKLLIRHTGTMHPSDCLPGDVIAYSTISNWYQVNRIEEDNHGRYLVAWSPTQKERVCLYHNKGDMDKVFSPEHRIYREGVRIHPRRLPKGAEF